MIRCLSILFLALGFSNQAYAATPFGISMGQPLSELDVSEEGSKPWLNTVPNPHPSFSDYIVWGSAETGVCLVMAISKRYENDRYGISVQNDFSEFVAALEGKYGSSTEIDFLRSGALWKDSNEWVMAIRQSERTYAATWDSFASDSDGANLAYLEISVVALSSDTAALRLMYKFENFEACQSSIDAEENSSF